MIPIGDFNPRRNVPVVTILLVLANAVVFLYQLALPEAGMQRLVYRAAMIPLRVTQYWGPGAATSLITSMFLHGSWMHIIGNMLYLWVFGDNIEESLGSLRYLLFYLASGVVASLAQIAIDPVSATPVIGASGAVAGVLGAYVVLFPRARVRTLVTLFYFLRVIELKAVIVLGLWFVLQLFNGLASITAMSSGGVAWFAHLGGFAAGVLVGALLRLKRWQAREQ
jgi:membrane associated rhomboid family serine protease